jgi:inorganic pyrophosphatase
VGVFFMRDEEGEDAKVLCVPATDPRWAGVRDLADLPPFLVEEVAHFFEVYKQLEPGKGTEIRGWEGTASAVAVLEAARRRRSETTEKKENRPG